jgi:hypothetical protein
VQQRRKTYSRNFQLQVSLLLRVVFRPGNRIPRLTMRTFVAFFSPSKQLPGQYLWPTDRHVSRVLVTKIWVRFPTGKRIFFSSQPLDRLWYPADLLLRDMYLGGHPQGGSAQRAKLFSSSSSKRYSYPWNRPWRPTGLWDVEAHRWRWGSQPYTPTAINPPGKFLALISVGGWVGPRAIVRLEWLRQLKNPMTSSGIKPATLRLVA